MQNRKKIKRAVSEDHPLEAAKWLSLPMMLNPGELENLLKSLGDIHIVKTLSRVEEGKEEISRDEFVSLYAEYVGFLKEGAIPESRRFKGVFSSVITLDLDALFSVPLDSGYHVVKVKSPIIQMQYHTMKWSKEEGKFRSQLFGQDSLPWGILFSYPQILLHQETKEIIKADSPGFINYRLFKEIQKWQRQHTIPTPFLVDERRINTSQRLGKECLSWIENHPLFKLHDLKIWRDSDESGDRSNR